MKFNFFPSQRMNLSVLFSRWISTKSPSSDGLNPTFLQKFQNLISDEIFRAGSNWLHPMEFLSSVNDTNIVLIPKYEIPVIMKDLRSILLCNIIYKIVSKVLANQFKKVLPKLISPYQFTFVPGRAIVDNVIATFELIHSMKRNTREIKCNSIKIDISKA